MLQPFFSAVRFLTILPVPESWCGGMDSFRKSPDWYPLVGLLIGLLAAGFDLLASWLLPPAPASVMVLVVFIGVTGALHMDGLADSADAFFSSRGRERMLEIMKDSCAGPMGVTAIVLDLLIKLTLLMSLPQQWRFEVILLMPICGRCAVSLISSRLTYARAEGGTAGFTAGTAGSRRALIAYLVLVVSAFLLLGVVVGSVVIVTTLLGTCWLSHYCRRKIGGYTGDTLGACCELIDLAPLVVAVAFAGHGAL